MSRAKNAVKFDSISDESIIRQYQAKRYGEKWDEPALEAIHSLHKALCSGLTTGNSEFDAKFNAKLNAGNRDKFFNYVAKEYLASWPSHDGSFFRKLANAMEVHQRPVEPAHTVFIGEIHQRNVRGMLMPTVSEMYRLIIDAEILVTRKTVERLFIIYQVTPTEAKRGPKPGTKQKSIHRRLRN